VRRDKPSPPFQPGNKGVYHAPWANASGFQTFMD
jgi:hypothetical protein